MRTITIFALAIAGFASTAQAAVEAVPFEQVRAKAEERLIIVSPIAGIENSLWFDYRINVIEAKKELASDLRGSSDSEDLRDSWEEYRKELKGERTHYIRKMAKRGFRAGTVSVG